MKRDLFRRYVWLVDIVRNGNRPTFDEISNAWDHATINVERAPLALRTFHNHRDAIEALFGIRILCNRSDHNRYYIAEDKGSSATRLKVWMIQTLSLSNTIYRASSLEDRFILDMAPEEKSGLLTVIEAIKEGKCLDILYSLPDPDGKTKFRLQPYCIRFWNSSWYVFGKDVEKNTMRAFDIGRTVSFKVANVRFNYPVYFNPKDYFKKFFGMEIDESLQPEAIRLKVSGYSRDMLRTLPLHESQKEVMAARDYSIFSYEFAPTEDFISKVLSMGVNCEVVSPEDLRTKVKDRVTAMLSAYEVPAAEMVHSN